MIFNHRNLEVYVHREPVDMRKGHDGLASIVEGQMKLELLSGAIFLFVNKSRRLCKALCFDGTGLVIIHKRMEVGSFMHFTFFEENQKITMSELALIFEGGKVKLPMSPKRFEYGKNKSRFKNES
ncbi:MAG: IS66 family insertion sequence element accessory protein TnpB [Halobacteriovoraceae bacterium]|mgnify:CR=1 FL=1|jgi:transposase|nr:IS66 family insertion sequence element accessory protein TnpB [Halobacteriovoraceae bacterium]